MNFPEKEAVIICDHRESRSGIPELLTERGISIHKADLKAGDYIINNSLLIERKTCVDFIRSIIDKRLFRQCRRLKNQNTASILLIEGDLYNTSIKIDRNAIRGAILSLAQAWQIPVVYANSKKESAEILLHLHQQTSQNKTFTSTHNVRSKIPLGQALSFLQGLPGIGAKLAFSLLRKFNTLENILLADEDELMEVEGLGHGKARQIRLFLSRYY